MHLRTLADAVYGSCPRRSVFKKAGFLLLAFAASQALGRTEWEPIAPDDLAATECKSHPGASAEGLFFRTNLTTSAEQGWSEHYNRIKIYSPKGAEEAGVLNIDYADQQKIWELSARLTKPDGSSHVFGESDFQDRTLAKLRGSKIKRKVLAVPGLEAGDILELQWHQGARNSIYTYRWWYVQYSYPVRRYLFSIERGKSQSDCSLQWFGLPNVKQSQEGKRNGRLEVTDIAPVDDEPFMPPQRDVRGWLLVYYPGQFMRWYSDKDSWEAISSYYDEEFRLTITPTAEIRKLAASLTAGAASDDEKLARLYDFCRTEISNLSYFDSAALQVAKKRIDESGREQLPAATLKYKAGYRHHINEVFASLAKAAGFDVRCAQSASRDATLQVRIQIGWLFLEDNLVRIRQGSEWKLYSPGDYYVPAGMIDSRFETADSLLCQQDKPEFAPNPFSPAAKSLVSRSGQLSVDADGNLEGDVEIAMGGHVGIAKKIAWHNLPQNEIDNEYRASLTERLPSAEISNLTWENLTGTALPLVARFHLKVPGYADVAGAKIILPPDVFEHGKAAIFSNETRKSPIYFDYAWSEHDEIAIQIPEGYTIDPTSGAPANVGDPAGLLGSRYFVSYKGKSRQLIYRRDFALANTGGIAFQVASYPALKDLFDRIGRSDEHAIILKPKPAPAAAPAEAAPQPSVAK